MPLSDAEEREWSVRQAPSGLTIAQRLGLTCVRVGCRGVEDGCTRTPPHCDLYGDPDDAALVYLRQAVDRAERIHGRAPVATVAPAEVLPPVGRCLLALVLRQLVTRLKEVIVSTLEMMVQTPSKRRRASKKQCQLCGQQPAAFECILQTFRGSPIGNTARLCSTCVGRLRTLNALQDARYIPESAR